MENQNNNLRILDILALFNSAMGMWNTERFTLAEESTKERNTIEDMRYLELKGLLLEILEKLNEQ